MNLSLRDLADVWLIFPLTGSKDLKQDITWQSDSAAAYGRVRGFTRLARR